MNTKLTNEDYKNILGLIAIAPIKGNEATTVAILQQKINGLINAPEPKKEEDKKTK